MSQILEFYQDNKENDDIYKLAKEYILIDTLSKNNIFNKLQIKHKEKR